MRRARQFQLARRPSGLPTHADFRLVEAALPDLGPGEVEASNIILSVDPYIRPRLDGEQPLDAPVIATGIARVVRSRSNTLREGDLVRHRAGLQEAFVVPASDLRRLQPDPALPLSVYMHALGATGLTAYAGLLVVGALREGEQVFVSTAAGAVGSVAAQIAKIKGCRVIGSTGSETKRAWLLEEAKLDAAINYRAEPLGEALRQAAPHGLDVYFENVGGAHLDAVLPLMNVRGRIPVCGMISGYNGGEAAVRNLFSLIYGRIRMEGFIASDFLHLEPQFQAEMAEWLRSGLVRYQETVLEGFDRSIDGLIGLFRGENAGKMLIRVEVDE